jgi:hypothetical protein
MMAYSVKDRAEFVGTFRWIAVHAMEMLARWVPTTPEMEVKVLFGRHVWDFAQHADALGRRAFELRAPMHYSAAPHSDWRGWMDQLARADTTAERVAATYDVLLPALARRHADYLAATDTLMDEPTVRILERWQVDAQRMRGERQHLPESMRHPGGSEVAAALAREAALAGLRAASPLAAA